MPRLVSLTLLSVLVLPAAALVYTLAVVIGEGYWAREVPVWLGANGLSFLIVVVWWSLVWRRWVDWTHRRIALTLLATAASVVTGLFAYYVVNYRFYGGFDFSSTAGGATAVLCWLVCTTILWRGGDAQWLGSAADGMNAR